MRKRAAIPTERTGQNFLPVTFDTIDLQRLQFGSTFSVDDDFILQCPNLQEWREETLRRMVFSLRGHVWAEPPKQVTVRYPRTWWDAFKARWFPAWLLEAHPAELNVETLEGQIFYPKLPQVTPDHIHNLRMAVHREPCSVPYAWNSERASYFSK